MLKSGKKTEDDKGFAFDKSAEQKTLTPAPSLETKAKKTVVGENISIEGNIRGDEDLVIEGSIKGNIEMGKHNFTVGPKGRVEGEINAQGVRISGQMIGNIKTQGTVEITKEADFRGDIKAKSISVETGAYFNGSIELDKEPQGKTGLVGKSKTVENSQPINAPKNLAAKEAVKEN
jgi:cytoskeletal protein CcmA (bactofilin family)